MEMSDQSIIILGASTRAAAVSALRAGWSPWCADLFADADLERVATVRKIASDQYPDGLLGALRDAPAGPVMYTGALENRPDLIARIDRPLWGNPPDVVRAIRSPRRWTQCLRDGGFPCPTVADAPAGHGRWLLKPRRSAGGFGIQGYVGQRFDSHTHFLQEHIDGLPCSGIYIGFGDDAAFLGATGQLIGTHWLNAPGFQYAGNIGPLPLEAEAYFRWQALGTTIARAFGLRGLFGIDAIVRDSVPWPVEINPRYPASLEILERSLGEPWLLWHRDAFNLHRSAGGSPASTHAGGPPAQRVHGKAILYARHTCTFPQPGPWEASLVRGIDLDRTEYADIPHPGDVIDAGRPVMTLFAAGTTVDECEAMLKEKADALARRLWG
ncbi:MAG: ATP-grasp domain-containing protein [Planctomycetes bacterium]|nr:ATP-grasp domain-containing protein [Planctomycetota bacterium]